MLHHTHTNNEPLITALNQGKCTSHWDRKLEGSEAGLDVRLSYGLGSIRMAMWRGRQSWSSGLAHCFSFAEADLHEIFLPAIWQWVFRSPNDQWLPVALIVMIKDDPGIILESRSMMIAQLCQIGVTYQPIIDLGSGPPGHSLRDLEDTHCNCDLAWRRGPGYKPRHPKVAHQLFSA